MSGATSHAYLTPAQVAELLNISKATTHRLIKAGRFPGAWKDGEIIRVPRADVEADIVAHRVKQPARVARLEKRPAGRTS